MSLKGKVVLVLADGENILPEQASRYAQLGATLVVHISRSGTQSSGAKLLKREQKSRLFTGALSTMTAVEHLLDEVVRDHGRVDLVVDATGQLVRGPENAQSTRTAGGLLAYAIFIHVQQRLTSQRYREESRRLLLGQA